ncbi:hypothetical protein LPTSP4_20500 [Leptospira ryugenii]|uniref:Uncharacterized protein n=1 Tax=Leptospira ryugenii TaxID=1917863 RepID=A0A2P2E0X1_9LEPT|nr:hypothetical protein [Leptospira ryugenii]GBF50524.1 hypothetical protein LPTSP4_20500 [Leptospira ryugenii]
MLQNERLKLKFWILCFIFTLSTSAEENTKERYLSPIPLSEKRIIEGKQEFKTAGKFPEEWKLFFKAKEGDFVVFYDWNGQEIHFRYRRNKFDEEGEEFVRSLFPGNPYLIKGQWIGYYFFEKDAKGRLLLNPIRRKLPANADEFTDKNSIPIFLLKKYSEIQSDELLY